MTNRDDADDRHPLARMADRAGRKDDAGDGRRERAGESAAPDHRMPMTSR